MTMTPAALSARLRRLHARIECGALSLELAWLALPVLAVVALVALGGWLGLGMVSIAGVAGDAARDASLARTSSQAQQIATDTAQADLNAQHLRCQGGATVTVDVSGFTAAPGTPGLVRVDVSCTVPYTGLSVFGIHASKTLHDHASSVVDPLRSAPDASSLAGGSPR